MMTYTVWVTSLKSKKRYEDSRHDSLEAARDAATIALSGGVPVEVAVIDSEGTERFRCAPGNI